MFYRVRFATMSLLLPYILTSYFRTASSLSTVACRCRRHDNSTAQRMPATVQRSAYYTALGRSDGLYAEQSPFDFCLAIRISAAYAVMRCPSVCLSRSCILLKRINIFSIFLPLRSHAILLFHIKRYGNIRAAQNRDFSTNIWLWHRSLPDRHMSSTFRQ